MSGICTYPVWILPFVFFFLISCNSDKRHDSKVDIDDLAHLHCEASQLKDARFKLADSIRFLQDSTSHHLEASNGNVAEWKLELERMEEKKLILANESRNLGDSIRQVIFQLTNHMSLDEKRTFNDNLKARTERLDCY